MKKIDLNFGPLCVFEKSLTREELQDMYNISYGDIVLVGLKENIGAVIYKTLLGRLAVLQGCDDQGFKVEYSGRQYKYLRKVINVKDGEDQCLNAQ